MLLRIDLGQPLALIVSVSDVEIAVVTKAFESAAAGAAKCPAGLEVVRRRHRRRFAGHAAANLSFAIDRKRPRRGKAEFELAAVHRSCRAGHRAKS